MANGARQTRAFEARAFVANALDVSRETSGLSGAELAVRALVRPDGTMVPFRAATRGLFRAGLRHEQAVDVYNVVAEVMAVAAAGAELADMAYAVAEMTRGKVRVAEPGISGSADALPSLARGLAPTAPTVGAVKLARELARADRVGPVAFVETRNDSGAREDYRARVDRIHRPKMIRGGL